MRRRIARSIEHARYREEKRQGSPDPQHSYYYYNIISYPQCRRDPSVLFEKSWIGLWYSTAQYRLPVCAMRAYPPLPALPSSAYILLEIQSAFSFALARRMGSYRFMVLWCCTVPCVMQTHRSNPNRGSQTADSPWFKEVVLRMVWWFGGWGYTVALHERRNNYEQLVMKILLA